MSEKVAGLDETGGGRRFELLRRPSSLWPSIAVAVIVSTVYVTFSARQWRSFEVLSWDLGIFTQLARRYAVLSPPLVTIKGADTNLLGDHFHPLLVLLGPIYAMFPHAFTLLVVQNVLFGIAAGIFTRSVAQRHGRPVGILLGLAFGFSWGLQYAVHAQFHEIAFAVPLLVVSLTALLDGRWRLAAAAASPLVFVKEDLGLTVAAIGVVLAWMSRKPLGLWLAVWGILWFALAAFVFIPWLNAHDSWEYTDRIDLLSLFASAYGGTARLVTVGLLMLVSAGIALRSPVCLIAVPTLAWRFMSSNEGYWGPTWHYSAILMPIAFVAMLDAVHRVRTSSAGWLRGLGKQAVTVSVIASLILVPTLPLARLADPDAGFAAPRETAAHAALAVIPRGSTVETDIGLMSYLVDDHDVYWIGNDNPTPDFIVVDRYSGGTPNDWGDAVRVADKLHPGHQFVIAFEMDGFEIARRTDASTPHTLKS